MSLVFRALQYMGYQLKNLECIDIAGDYAEKVGWSLDFKQVFIEFIEEMLKLR